MTRDPLERLRAADPLGGALPSRLPHLPARPERHAPGRALALANVALLVAVAVHGVDHAFVQDRGLGSLGAHVVIGGVSMFSASAISTAAALVRDRRARALGLACGAWVVLLAFAGHFLPADLRGTLDPYAGLGLDPFSWIAAGSVVVTGVLVVAAAARVRFDRMARTWPT